MGPPWRIDQTTHRIMSERSYHRAKSRSKVEQVFLIMGLEKERKGNVLFNDALNTIYLQLYGIRHMVKYHSDSERGNLLLPHGLLFPINSMGSLIYTIPQTGLYIHHENTIHQGDTSRGVLVGTKNSSMSGTGEGFNYCLLKSRFVALSISFYNTLHSVLSVSRTSHWCTATDWPLTDHTSCKHSTAGPRFHLHRVPPAK